MLKILGTIFFFVILLFLGGLGLIAYAISRLFNHSFRKVHKENIKSRHTYGERGNDWETLSEEPQQKDSQTRKKIFGEDEGEYVDFEEIKEGD